MIEGKNEMIYVEAPDIWPRDSINVNLFLAGGITECPDWQKEMVRQLEKTSITILNPRRVNFPINDPSAAERQIKWEFHAMRSADAIQFWFPKETLCPIVLYELGAWSMTDKKIFVGVDLGYKRIQDVMIQTKLARPDVFVVGSLPMLARQIREWCQ